MKESTIKTLHMEAFDIFSSFLIPGYVVVRVIFNRYCRILMSSHGFECHDSKLRMKFSNSKLFPPTSPQFIS